MEERIRGNSDRITRDYFDSLLIEMQHLDGKVPDTTFSLYNEKFQTPIMTAALSHLKSSCGNGMVEMAKGARLAGAVNWAGMGDEQELEAMLETGARTIKIIKPYADNSIIQRKLEHAEKSGAFAVGMDIDHAFGGDGKPDLVLGALMAPKSKEEIAEFVKMTKLPFIVKGVLSERDAYKCVMAGARGIVVSHHHGIMDYAVPPLMILPDILKVVAGEIPVFVDCGIISGIDAFKALALGATAVSVGRVIMEPLSTHGSEGVKNKLEEMTSELRGIMAKTGCSDLQHMENAVIRKRLFV